MGRSHLLRRWVAGTAAAGAIAATVSPAGPAAAGIGVFQIRLKIEKACTAPTGTSADADAGNVAPTSVTPERTETASVDCAESTPYTVGHAPPATDRRAGEAASTSDVSNAEAATQITRSSEAVPANGTTDPDAGPVRVSVAY